MAVTARVFGPAAQSLLRGEFGDVQAAGALKCLLIESGPPSADLRYVSELTGEVDDPSYARQTLTGVLVTYDAATNTVKLDCDDVTFPNLTALVAAIVFFRDTTVAATSPLLVVWDLAPTETSTAAPYVVTIHADGLLRQVVA